MSKSEAKKDEAWATAITQIEPNRVAVRGYNIAEMMGEISFGAAVYLIITGQLPTTRVARLMDAILVSSIDHGATPPSALTARTVASTGASLSQCVSAGILAINRWHGGAIEGCARQLGRILLRCDECEEDDEEQVTVAMLEEMKAAGERMSGFGHRIHSDDPRTGRLFQLAREAGVEGRHMVLAKTIERIFADSGRSLPLNVDGAIAAILADLEIDPRAMNGFFMIARTPGLVAHALEEQTRQRPMRRIDPVNHQYDGPTGKRMGEG